MGIAKQGWLCPCCRTVWSPDTTSCGCQKYANQQGMVGQQKPLSQTGQEELIQRLQVPPFPMNQAIGGGDK